MQIWWLSVRGQWWVAGIPIHGRTGQKMFLSWYLALVLFALSGLILRGEVFVFVGLICGGCAFFGCCYHYYKDVCAKCLRLHSFYSEGCIGEEEYKVLNSS
jgi:hypothetical protein